MTERRFDPYLWDRSGEPDEQFRMLEALLERYRYDTTTPAPGWDPNDEAEEETPP